MKGAHTESWRIRVGAYRILYVIDDGVRVVEVREVGHRKDIYDSLRPPRGGTISTGVLTRSTIDLAELQTGVVLFRLHTEHGLVLKRFLAE